VWDLEERLIKAPSIATVNRILKAGGYFEKPARRFASKGRRYPVPQVFQANDVHQNDFVGPRYLRGGVRFYSFNTSDLKTARSTAIPIANRSSESVVSAIWQCWGRLGKPKIFQIDNELVFWGSRQHPRGLGQVLRLCLREGVEALFIPPAEPWRNGVIEKCNDHWQQKFLNRTEFDSFDHLVTAALDFDGKRNSRWRYGKNRGLTPNVALTQANVTLTFPEELDPPALPMAKPITGRYHLVRLIRSDRVLDLFGEKFVLAPIATHEYVTATVNVAEQTLRVTLDGQTIEERDYKLR
jgi:hypothetical protein